MVSLSSDWLGWGWLKCCQEVLLASKEVKGVARQLIEGAGGHHT